MSVVDLADRRVVATVPVGQAPRKIAVQPSTTGAAVPQIPTVQMDAEDYAFHPAAVAERPGTAPRLRVTSRSSTLHNFTLPRNGSTRTSGPATRSRSSWRSRCREAYPSSASSTRRSGSGAN